MIHLLLVLTVLAAVQEQAGDMRFTLPAGWKRTNFPTGQVMLEPPGLPPGRNCSVIVQPAQDVLGELRPWMLHARKAFIGEARVVSEDLKDARVGGYPAMTWSGVLEGRNGTISIYVVATQVNGKAEVMMFGADDRELFQKHLPEVKKLVDSISFERPKLDGLEGVYWRAVQRPNFDGSMSWNAGFDWIVLSGDSRVLRGLPDGGWPACFATPDAATSPKFGRYVVARDRISITYNPDPYIGKQVTQTAKKVKDGIEVDGQVYRKLPDNDGLLLDGRYVREDAEIVFTKDGRFREKGLRYAGFVSEEMLYPERPRLPEHGGSGRYSIENNTLTVRYDGGVTRNIFFFTTDNPAAVKTVVVNTYGYLRRD